MKKDELIKARDVLDNSQKYHDGSFYIAIRTAIEALDAQIKACDVPSGWQPIETAPRDGTVILIAAYIEEEFMVINDRWYQDRIMGDWESWHEMFDQIPTHWMPLKQPPKALARAEGIE